MSSLDGNIFSPVAEYNNKIKPKFKKESEAYFDDLVKNSQVDIEANRKSNKELLTYLGSYEKAKKRASTVRITKNLVLSLGIIALVVGVIFLYLSITANKETTNMALYISLTVVLLIAGLFGIIFSMTFIRKKLQSRELVERKALKKCEDKKQECYAQLSALNNMYDWNTVSDIVKKAIPNIVLDPYYDVKKEDLLENKYGLGENGNKISCLGILSGSINGNPFLMQHQLINYTGQKTYYGTMLVTYSVTVSDGNGGTRRETRTATITASVTKPCEFYKENTFLVYGNDAASKLSFSRVPSGTLGKDEKDIAKMVEKGAKSIQKRADKAITSGGKDNYTPLGNKEFEYLFGAFDRDNEMEFRLLFTPLAQKNLTSLIKSQAPFGDDFYFTKFKCLNFIASKHSQSIDYTLPPELFINYNIDNAKAYFVDRHLEFIQGLYFDLAPILSIPLYQRMKNKEFIYKSKYDKNYTDLEEESLANKMPTCYFMPTNSITQQILKCQFVEKNGSMDQVKVISHSYKGITHIDYVPTPGPDGKIHSVPVEWIEYIPQTRENMMAVQNFSVSNEEYKETFKGENQLKEYLSKYTNKETVAFRKGLLAFLLFKAIDSNSMKDLQSLINTIKK